MILISNRTKLTLKSAICEKWWIMSVPRIAEIVIERIVRAAVADSDCKSFVSRITPLSIAQCIFSSGEWSLWSSAISDEVCQWNMNHNNETKNILVEASACTKNALPTPGWPTSCPIPAISIARTYTSNLKTTALGKRTPQSILPPLGWTIHHS